MERCVFMSSVIIKHIEDYIKIITDVVNSRDDSNSIITYRGENREFSNPCVPNIFREKYLKKCDYFEKNIFDEMRANQIAKGEKYLEIAISAQHDGFPSRLLDVSYNSLVALYFACTPYYRYNEDKYDGENGKVFIFFIDKVFCPTGDNITNTYEDIVLKKDTFLSSTVFSKNHKLIDHLKINNRIIAQQGAFILFQGNDVEYLPQYMYEEVVIPGSAKKALRKELKELFGIYTGSIYPEAENLIEEIKNKSLNVENTSFDLNGESKILICNLENEIKYYLHKIFSCNGDECTIEVLKRFEKIIRSYQLGIMGLTDDCYDPSVIFNLTKNYNDLVEEAFDNIDIFFKGKIKTSKEYFMIKDE